MQLVYLLNSSNSQIHGKRKLQAILTGVIDYAARLEFLASSPARFHGSNSSMRLMG